MLSITLQCYNCNNIFEAEQHWGQSCPRCGSLNTGLLGGGHTFAKEEYTYEDWLKHNEDFFTKWSEHQNIVVNFNFFEEK